MQNKYLGPSVYTSEPTSPQRHQKSIFVQLSAFAGVSVFFLIKSVESIKSRHTADFLLSAVYRENLLL